MDIKYSLTPNINLKLDDNLKYDLSFNECLSSCNDDEKCYGSIAKPTGNCSNIYTKKFDIFDGDFFLFLKDGVAYEYLANRRSMEDRSMEDRSIDAQNVNTQSMPAEKQERKEENSHLYIIVIVSIVLLCVLFYKFKFIR